MFNNNTKVLIGIALVLAITYLTLFTDVLHPKKIQIAYSQPRMIAGAKADAVIFALDKPYVLTSVKVVSTDEARTNKFPHALWHLVADLKQQPVNAFLYGAHIRGMKPDVPNAVAESLQGNENYSLIVEAGTKLKGEIVFHLASSPDPGN